MCRIRCIRIYACGLSQQTKVALAKSDREKQEINIGL